MKIGIKIKELRTKNNLTQKDLGNKAGIPQTTISDWENLKSDQSIDSLSKIANAFNVSLVDLLKEI